MSELRNELVSDILRLVTISLSVNADNFDYLPELLALTKYESFINLVNCLGGDTIRIPTRKELRRSLAIVLVMLYNEVNYSSKTIKDILHLSDFIYNKYYDQAMKLKDKLTRYQLVYNNKTDELIDATNKMVESLSDEVDQAAELTHKFSGMLQTLPEGVTALSTKDLFLSEYDVKSLIISLLSSYNQLV